MKSGIIKPAYVLSKIRLFIVLFLPVLFIVSCKKDQCEKDRYYEVGFTTPKPDWRDTAFVVRTNNRQLIKEIEAQLALPVSERKLVVGTLAAGSGGYNKNASHEFKWHFKEDDWGLADVTIEIYDGRPYTDVDVNLSYWMDTVKRFGPWSSYIKRKLPR